MNELSLPPAMLISLFEQLPGCWGCKDTQFRFVHVNQNYARLVGARSPHELIGKRDSELPGALAQCAEQFCEQDRQVLKSGQFIRVLNIHPYPDGRWHAHVFTKVPWYGDDGELLGTIFHGLALNENPILEVGQWICKAAGFDTEAALNAESVNKDVSLSTRESEVLFFHLYGKKPQFIAQSLGVSVKTIENHFANLRVKLGASSKTELVDKALENGVGRHIPDSLLKQQLSLVLTS